MVEPNGRLLPSVLDRLIDLEPDVSTEPAWSNTASLDDIMDAVRRDLENLLNTRRSRLDKPDMDSEIGSSLLYYGVPDFSSLSADEAGDQVELARAAVESAIVCFERRLRNVEVTVLPLGDRIQRKLQLHIKATLLIDPIREPVEFDAEVETATGACNVKWSG